MSWILGALKIIIVLGTLITIHELGHFLVAKACNVKVHKFSIGFGKKILSKQKGETEYTLRLFPFGGFVQLEGEEERSDDPRAFNNKPIWQRMLIIAAGATVNIVFALLVYYGVCIADNAYTIAQIDAIAEGSVLNTSGIENGDKILSINGKKTVTARHVEDIIQNSKLDEMLFVIERNGKEIQQKVNIPYTSIGLVGIIFKSDQNGVIDAVEPNSPAEKAGIVAGNRIVAVNGVETSQTNEIVSEIRANPDREVQILIATNDGSTTNYKVTPSSTKIRISGIQYSEVEDLNFFENSYYAIDETGYYFNANISAILKMFSGDMGSVQVVGPVGIAQEISSTEAISQFFLLMAAISISLGLFNLFPVPALDGGKLLILVIELIRRKPMKEKTEITVQLVGLSLLMVLAIYVTVGDIIKLF